MDIHLLDAAPTVAERAAVEHVLGPPAGGWDGGARDSDRQGHSLRGGGHEARSRRHLLLPVLLAVQEHIGWVSPGALNHIAERLTVPPADVYGVATFYALLSVEPRPARVIHVCEDLACRCNGSQELIAQLEEHMGAEGDLNADGSATWLRSPCLGQCDRAPAAMVTLAGEHPEEHVLAPVDASGVLAAIDGRAVEGLDPVTSPPQSGDAALQLLARVGNVDPTSLDDYRAAGGYQALRLAIEMGGAGVIRELKDSRLMGRGGAAFPTGVKWEAVAQQPAHPHYLICNADESEPGTFKDRVVIEGDPYSLIEAMTIAAFSTGCEHGYVYLRGEYPQAHAILGAALAEARRRGYLGDDILGEGFSFDIEIRKGGGAYICGEETAIFNSIEGFRGEPRSKPPFPVVAGLFGKPTVVNNVETLVNVLSVVLESGPGYAETGTEGSSGTKLFCLSGNIERAGRLRGAVRDDAARAARAGRRRGGRAPAADGAHGRSGRRLPEAGRARSAAHVRGRARGQDDARLGRRARAGRPRRPAALPAAHRGLLPQRVVRAVRALPRRDGATAGGAGAPGVGTHARRRGRRARPGRGDRPVHARRLDLRPRADGVQRHRIGDRAPRRLRRCDVSSQPLALPKRMIELEVDGEPVRVFEGQTILDALRKLGVETPTLCYGDTLQPANACRVCVVELEGARVLAPSCSRKAEAGMKVRTDSERVRHSRRLVLELLASSVDLSTTPVAEGYLADYDAQPERFGPPAPPDPDRDRKRAGHHVEPDGQTAATVAGPVKIDNELYVRDYSKCILCYKCVDACGEQYQNTFAITVAGRGFDARISTEFVVELPESACVYCGNCIAVCPTGALMFRSEHELREAGEWKPGEQAVTQTICPYCGVGCNLELHVQDNEIVKVTSPDDHDVTRGNLCIKGRFGYQHVQGPRRREE